MTEYTSKELVEAESVLRQSDHGRRIFVAENALKLMGMGQLTRLKQLFFGARHEVRRIDDHKLFQERFEQSDLADFNKLSTPLGYVVSTLNGDLAPHTVFYCTEGLTEEVVSMLTSSIAKHMAVNYAALGFDIRSIIDSEEAEDSKAKSS